ncbi:MAG: hypothetical protein LIP06_02850 [Tannerellaceae bacterium]|nr:hypothetical protein [Tannerellaceae bacterium]
MEYKVYGHTGKPVLVFPTSNGRFYQYEDSGMIRVLSPVIEQGKIQIWTTDSIDWETYFSDSWDKLQRIHRHEQYFAYIKEELIPSVLWKSKENNGGQEQQLVVTGCSMGAYHAANFFFRNPWHIDTLIALSGVYSTDYFFGDYKPTEIYLNSPVDYLQNNHEDPLLTKYKQARLFFCCGRGADEELMLKDTRALQQVLESKEIPARFDYWGTDSVHDWDWWQRQAVHFFNQIE